MTYSARFSASAYTEEEAHEISADPDALKEIRDQRVSMLNKYSTAGLREIHMIACFLTQVIDWAVQDDSQGMFHPLVSQLLSIVCSCRLLRYLPLGRARSHPRYVRNPRAGYTERELPVAPLLGAHTTVYGSGPSPSSGYHAKFLLRQMTRGTSAPSSRRYSAVSIPVRLSRRSEHAN